VYYDNLTRDERSSGWNRNSLYSGHTATAAASSFFAAKVYSDFHPDASKLLLYSLAAVPPLFIGYLRIISLEHFPSDVALGLGIGALCGVLIPELHKIQGKNLQLGMYASPDAAGITATLHVQ
jgi:membrane-associated phospholipid phosphatase